MTRWTWKRRLGCFLGALGLAVALTGCGDDRECLEGHTEVMPVTTTVCHSTGKTVSCSPVVQVIPVFVCDRYAPEPGREAS